MKKKLWIFLGLVASTTIVAITCYEINTKTTIYPKYFLDGELKKAKELQSKNNKNDELNNAILEAEKLLNNKNATNQELTNIYEKISKIIKEITFKDTTKM
ncbi:hypothetical protein [Mycoplasma hafezii]|uniref:hypothetical protein n=1 Tax=Mycoplasma hafezii TaxID=525886 RepID=UPI003CF7AA85